MTRASAQRPTFEGDESEAPYDPIAGEYYDEEAHPTCADLRRLSIEVARPWVARVLRPGLNCAEFGAGMSVLGECIKAANVPCHLTLVDNSAGMLAHSHPFQAEQLVTSATDVPLSSTSLDLIVIALGDAFNEPGLWLECERLLRPGGTAVFTTPAYEWATSFRKLEGSPPDVARFVLRDGRTVDVPSMVLPVEEQQAMITDAGLVLDSHRHVGGNRVPIRSRKLLDFVDTKQTPLLTGFVLSKPTSVR